MYASMNVGFARLAGFFCDVFSSCITSVGFHSQRHLDLGWMQLKIINTTAETHKF